MHLDLPEKRYYGIGEVARAFGVNTSLIRFWEKEFEEIQPRKNSRGNRKYTQEDVRNIQLIHHLVKERGFTLDGAKIHLKEEKQQALTNFQIIEKLQKIRTELIRIKEGI